MPWDLFCFAGRIRDITVVPLLYVILPNLPVWIFERKMALSPHGYINVECLLVGILAIFLPRFVIFLLLVFEACAAFIYLVCYTYQFSLSNLFASAQYLFLLPAGHIPLILTALATVIALSIVVAFGPPRPHGRARIFVPAILLLTACLSITIDTLNGRNPVLRRDASQSMPRITISPLLELGRRRILSRSVEVFAANSKNVAMPSASAAAIRPLRTASPADSPNVVLVLVESWGFFRDSELANELTAGYQDPAIYSKYRVSFGTAPFDGLTIPGEARELCHSEMGLGVINITPAQERGCLPAIMHSHGYQDIAVHGFAGGMFDRDEWYKAIGFDQRWFGPDLERLGLSHCDGAFPGICDGDVADWIGRSLLADTADRPRFVYWVTLNSHLPVSQAADLPADSNVCPAYSELRDSSPLCSWFRLVLRVHRSVQRLALQERNRPTVFILVGDHAPPFATPHLRDLFSDSQVPYVILTPRDRASIDDAMSHGGS